MERYKQRFNQFQKALIKMEEAINYIEEQDLIKNSTEPLNNLVKQGLIQNFEFTHELAWKLMKDYAEYQNPAEIHGSRDATREAFSMGIISNGELWMEMIKSRNETSHTYNEELANEIFLKIVNEYFPEFKKLKSKFNLLIK